MQMTFILIILNLVLQVWIWKCQLKYRSMLLLYILHLWGILHVQFLTELRPYIYIYKAAINLVAGVPVTDVTEYLNSTAWDNWRQDQGFDYPGNAWTNNKKYTSNAM